MQILNLENLTINTLI